MIFILFILGTRSGLSTDRRFSLKKVCFVLISVNFLLPYRSFPTTLSQHSQQCHNTHNTVTTLTTVSQHSQQCHNTHNTVTTLTQHSQPSQHSQQCHNTYNSVTTLTTLSQHSQQCHNTVTTVSQLKICDFSGEIFKGFEVL
jgi:hypothetical protein